jgi:methyl-accepting chemotaxis protein-1 (serine sensor receptor)
MNRLKISTRVALLASLLSLLALIMGGLGLWGISRTNDALHAMYEENLNKTAEIGQIQALLLRQRLLLATALVTPDDETIAKNTAMVDTNIASITRVWNSYLARPHSPPEAQLAASFTENRGRFVREGLLPTVAALRARDIPAATQSVVEKVRTLYTPVGTGIEALLQWQMDQGKAAYQAADARYITLRTTAIAAMVLGLLFTVLFATVLVRGITQSLRQAIEAAQAIAQGDLSQTITAIGQDEAAQVLRALATMQQQLTHIVADIRAGGESVASASSQIFNGNNDLAVRTEQQASALEQTAAAMEQLNATVQHNADHSLQAEQLATSASNVAVRGGEVMGQVVATMQDIQASSSKIADITGVIDGIAFQTNILALNAAVEAARAGEQGRGFAVVASEVRSLAGRSATAAKEIKDLIQASAARVSQGTTLVNTAGATMQEAVSAIQRVSLLMTDIRTAGTEQSSGMAQIGIAVQHLDQSTQQNAALVEELSAAARSLQDQAHDQVEAIAVFTLGHYGTRPSTGTNAGTTTKQAATIYA